MSRTLVRVLFALWLCLALAPAAWAQEKVCPKCFKGYSATSKFCTDDGSTLVVPEKCPKCATVRAGKAKYCASCGFDFEKPPVPTCPKCGRTAPLGTKYCTDCGTALVLKAPPVGMPSGNGGGTTVGTGGGGASGPDVRQWAESVVQASSQYGIRLFSKDQILGPPDVQRPGQDGRAWCPSLAKRGTEFIVVQFARTVVPKAVRIHETASQGFVTRVDALVGGSEVVIWEGADPANKSTPILEVMAAEPPPATNQIKITINTDKVRNAWTEIDAVELIGPAAAGGAGAGGPVAGGHDDHEHGGDVTFGPLGVRAGSEFRYQVTRGRQTETLVLRVHHVSEKTVGLAWTVSGDRTTAGYVQLLQTNLARGATYDDRFPEEQAETLAAATALWLPRHVHLSLREDQKARLEIAGVGPVVMSGANQLAQSLTVNGKATAVQVVSSYLNGGGKLTVHDDPSTPIVVDMERSGFRMSLLAADQVGGPAAPVEKPPVGNGGIPPAGTGSTPGGTPGGTPPATVDPALPVYATADACFEAWKKALDEKNKDALALAYVAAERKAMQADPDLARQVFDRYSEAKGRFTVESKKEAGSTMVWVVEVRVREVFWTRKAKETFKFVKEGESYRVQIERDGF